MDAAVHDEAIHQDGTPVVVAPASSGVGEVSVRQVGERDGNPRRDLDKGPASEPIAPHPQKPSGRRRIGAIRFLLRKVATVTIATVAVAVALLTWDQYNAGPWTRDGRLRVQVASVAPQIGSNQRPASHR